MEVAVFLFSALVISLSGVMAPGPITAATIALGAQSQSAGALIAVGHAIIEFPLMFAIVMGFNRLIKLRTVQIVIGIIGGVFMLWMGAQMIHDTGKPDFSIDGTYKSGPLLTGIILTACNAYFLLWWATIGLKLATDARLLGIATFILFTVLHWLCDLVWCLFLGWTSFKGSEILGATSQRVILGVCGTALVLFSVKFIYGAGLLWRKHTTPDSLTLKEQEGP